MFKFILVRFRSCSPVIRRLDRHIHLVSFVVYFGFVIFCTFLSVAVSLCSFPIVIFVSVTVSLTCSPKKTQ